MCPLCSLNQAKVHFFLLINIDMGVAMAEFNLLFSKQKVDGALLHEFNDGRVHEN